MPHLCTLLKFFIKKFQENKCIILREMKPSIYTHMDTHMHTHI